MARIGITISLLALLVASPALAGSISLQVAETGQTTLTKTFTVADADVDRIVAAYQAQANSSVNGTATRAQVLNYWATQVAIMTKSAVSTFEASAAASAVVPPVIQ